MKKRLLVVIAHPDDEAFGPGGTLAKYAREGVNIQLLCATRGEEGKTVEDETRSLGEIRAKELEEAAAILGIKDVEFLGFQDGYLSNVLYHDIADKISEKIDAFEPQVVLTFDRLGISGHIDHIVMAMTTTFAFIKQTKAKKLYYHVLDKALTDKMPPYFIYVPEGYAKEQITTTIDISSVWDTKVKAMHAHKSQMRDVDRILSVRKNLPKEEYYILGQYKFIQPEFPEQDLFDQTG